ncbi:MAG: hypothetical protein Q9182_005739 [Xanthomendoza sp. 2 TL-2023]
MATVRVDSELMQSWVSAVPVPASNDFRALKDSNGRPLVLSLGNDNVLYLLVASSEGQSGTYQIIDMTRSLGLSADKDKVVAYDAVQSISSKMIYIVLSVESPSNWHRMLVLRPFLPDVAKLPSMSFKEFIVPQPSNFDAVKGVYLGSPDVNKKSYPSVVLSYEPGDRLMSQSLVALKLSDDLSTWTLNKNLKLGENADQILDVCSGALGGDKGVFTLYRIQGNLSIKFTAVERLRETSLNCPKGKSIASIRHPDIDRYKGATRIAPVFKADGSSDLIVAGEGLTYFKSSDMAYKGADGFLISNDPMFRSVRDLDVSINTSGDPTISVFVSNKALALGYVTTSIKKIGREIPPTIPLLPEGQGGYFASFVASSGNKSLICASNDGTLTLFEQAADTLLWKRSPFNVASLDKNIEITCHQTRLTLLDAQQAALTGGKAIISSSGSLLLTINGQQTILDGEGTEVTADHSGAITIVCPTGDISAYTYTITDISDSKAEPLDGALTIDPAQKVHNRMMNLLATDGALKSAKTPSGDLLAPGAASMPSQDLKIMTDGMRELLKVRADIGPKPGVVTNSVSMALHPKVAAQGVKVLAGSAPNAGDSWVDKAERQLWSAWLWVERQVNKVKNWVLRAANGVYEFILDVGGKIVKFVIDTITNISKALSWMWDKLKAGWKKMVEFFGFLFSWKDIIECKNSTYDFVNSALTACAGRVDKVADKVDRWFEDMKINLRNSTLPPELANTSTAPPSSGAQSEKTGDAASAGWTNYQLQHGGALKQSKVQPQGTSTGNSTEDALSKLFQKYIGTLADSLQKTASDVGEKLVLLFDSDRSVSAGKVVQAIGSDILVGVLDLIRLFVVDLIRLGADILKGLQSLLTCRINMPIFTRLYEDISGRPCNVLDIISLILAIPMTIITKIFTGEKPPLLPTVSPDTYNKMIDGGQGVSKEDQLKFNQMSASIGLGAISLQTICDIVEIAGSAVPIAGGIAGVIGGPFALDGKLIMGVIGRAASFPAYKRIPALEIAITIWGLSTLATFVRAAIRRLQAAIKASGVGTAAQYAQQKFLAGLEIVLAVVSIGLWSGVGGLEYTSQAAEYPDWIKDQDDTTYKLTGSLLTQLGTVGTSVGVLVDEPITKAVAGAVSGVAGASSYAILAARHYRALGKGRYASAISKI